MTLREHLAEIIGKRLILNWKGNGYSPHYFEVLACADAVINELDRSRDKDWRYAPYYQKPKPPNAMFWLGADGE